jgi:DNA-binding MarR family transcriptional regulator
MTNKRLVEAAVDAHRDAFRALERVAAPDIYASDLTMGQVRALVTLLRQGAMPIGKLGECLGVGLPSASSLVDRLVQMGYVERYEDPEDRRRTMARLTAHAESRMEAMRQGSRERITEWFARLPEEDLAALLQGLQALIVAAEQMKHGEAAVAGSPGRSR